ncbi:N-formylglutamate deformylase [Pseudoalteromonas sp. NBT06-2]|uniref:N-formylglutamate deformylase n=1 Tax=Pseudoalteromonas sp. NBT06-2 TaxID=2025950 RepID=UPI000BA5D058|nr:N-formylglutamate deformylase [Pseudoalteromonas sp. NBT06-2]PAJ73088.1 N-formylglutamate deformylase [Pseudoalteromonas sp. NBT06-2]
MASSYTLTKGKIPLLISMPHNGEAIADEIKHTMTEVGINVTDTDWYMDKLYDFAEELGIYVINPKYSRFVIDLNRDPNGVNLYPGQNTTELCPTTAFDLSPLYLEGMKPNEAEIKRRVELYWRPYHQAIEDTLNQMKQEFGKAVLLEAHSILSHVPRFFEGQLPDFNFGTSDGVSCDKTLISQVEALNFSPYSNVTNGRFKGGFITRHFGKPEQNIHALQLELSQITYMNEPSNEYNETKAAEVKLKLRALVEALAKFAQNK